MTSRVIVHAHCASTKQVVIQITSSPDQEDHQIILQDGEIYDLAVYDDKKVSVFEEIK